AEAPARRAERRRDAGGPEPAVVLADVPAVVGGLPLGEGRRRLGLGRAGGPILLGEEEDAGSPEHLPLGVPRDEGGTGVPRGDPPLGVHREDGVLPDALDEEPVALLALAEHLAGLPPLPLGSPQR